jgi:FtsP/CotA-like multicopper oxidase with cupredoxin domain
VHTFADAFDFSGKTIFPFTTAVQRARPTSRASQRRIELRRRFQRMAHCHIAGHNQNGMMFSFEVEPGEASRVSNA